METLDYNLLRAVKRSFVNMPAGAGPGPVAGGGMLTQGQAAPIGDLSAQGGDPSQVGQPMDPSMMGGDPSMMGGDPSMAGGMPPGGDPSMAGGDPSMMAGPAGEGMPVDPSVMAQPSTGMITITPEQLIAIITASKAAGPGGDDKKSKPKAVGADAKLDHMMQHLNVPPMPQAQ